jgi:hypothetical protein
MFRNPLARVLALSALFAVGATALSPGVAEAGERPFKAMLAGNALLSRTANPCVMRNDETAAGEATHLGPFTLVGVEYVDFCSVPGGVTVVGALTMTADNGDKLHMKYTAIGFANEAGTVLTIRADFVFAGGTGRFADATGSGVIDVTAYFAPGLPFEATMNGTIDY